MIRILPIFALTIILFPFTKHTELKVKTLSQRLDFRSYPHNISKKKIRVPRNAHIVCIGDSLTTGETANTNWPTVLRTSMKKAGRQDVKIHNEGEGGISSLEFWNDEPSEHYKKSSVNNYQDIHIAFILLGHNDTRTNGNEPRNRNNHQTPEEYSSNMNKIILWLKSRKNKSGIRTRVVIIVPPQAREPVVRNSFNFPVNFNKIMQEPNGYINKLLLLSKKHKLPVIYTHSVFDGGPGKYRPYRRGSSVLIGDDSIHLNDSGQRTLAQCVMDRLDIYTEVISRSRKVTHR